MSNANFRKLLKEGRLHDPEFTGDPSFLEAPTFAGNPVFSGTPVFTGNPVFSGSPSFTGQANPAGAGITAGSGTVVKSSVERIGEFVKTTILVDLTGLTSSATGGDIIGKENASACYLTQITAAVNGTIMAGSITCVELPAGGDLDIDLFSATEATGTEDGAVGSLTSTALHANGGNWALSSVKALTAWPAADQYLYLTVGGTTAGNYSAGRLLIELYGV